MRNSVIEMLTSLRKKSIVFWGCVLKKFSPKISIIGVGNKQRVGEVRVFTPGRARHRSKDAKAPHALKWKTRGRTIMALRGETTETHVMEQGIRR